MNDISKGIEKVVVNDVSKPKSKNLDVIAEFEKTKQKPTANFVVIGRSFNAFRGCLDACLPDLE